MQKPIEGSIGKAALRNSMQFSIYKGAIDCSEHNSTEVTFSQVPQPQSTLERCAGRCVLNPLKLFEHH
jgi:hypothetical protein